MKYTLLVNRDPSTGELGLVLDGVQIDDMPMVDTDGYSIAHDIVEHVSGTEFIGEIQDELIALGAMWYVRGQLGDLRRDGRGIMHSVEQHFASDVSRMYEDFCCGTPLSVRGRPLRKTRSSEIDHVIDTILEEAQLRHVDGSTATKRTQYEALVRQAMRVGYSTARRKYESRGRFFANNLFWNIQEAVERVHKYHELFDGMTFTMQTVGDDVRITLDEVYV